MNKPDKHTPDDRRDQQLDALLKILRDIETRLGNIQGVLEHAYENDWG